MAFFCLSVIERDAGRRAQAAKKYSVDVAIFNKIGELTSTRGDELEARKHAGIPFSPLASAEAAWLQESIRAVIRQTGLVAAGASVPSLEIASLPKL
jgi:hypothetical protein